MNMRLKDDDIKRVLDFMQRQLLQERGISHDINYHVDELNNHKKRPEREMLQYLDVLQNFQGTENEKGYKSHEYEKGHDIHKKIHVKPTSIVLFKPQGNNEFKSAFLLKFLNEIVRDWKHRPEIYVKSLMSFDKSKQAKSKKLNFDTELQKLKNFSKFYLILNTSPTKRIVNEEDLKQVSTLLSSILSTKPTKSQRKRKNYYKGFAINDELLSSLRRRDSDEYFSKKYSADDNYILKQSRSRYGDSVGGRTAIPFTGKHRDVYEDY